MRKRNSELRNEFFKGGIQSNDTTRNNQTERHQQIRSNSTFLIDLKIYIYLLKNDFDSLQYKMISIKDWSKKSLS